MSYKECYGDWGGNPSGKKPDFTRCCETVYPSSGFPIPHQCSRKRGYGLDKMYCKQHDPEAVKARQQAADERYKADSLKWSYSWYGKRFHDALKQIADGHNNPRALAIETLKVMDK